jgi:Domain of unknown function (DUF4388)
MRTILGRLSDLGLEELFRLLTSAGAEGALEIESAGAQSRLWVRQGHVAGEPSAPLVRALALRSGTFCFRPGDVPEAGNWRPVEEFSAHLEMLLEQAGLETVNGDQADAAGPPGPNDPLAELRASLAQLPLPGPPGRILVVTADPRPYRALETEWRRRGWEIDIRDTPEWADGPAPALLIVHLPSSATLAGQGAVWLDLARQAAGGRPPTPVLWVGGLVDPWLRHQAVLAGVEFLLPVPAGSFGEAARWFRDELSLLAERALARRASDTGGEEAAFRDFFVALHVDASPADVRASLLRFSGTFFTRGVLFAVRESGFESLGGYGFPRLPASHLPRGDVLLEEVVVSRRSVKPADHPDWGIGALAAGLGVGDALPDGELFPLLSTGECVAIFLGDTPVAEVGDTASLAGLLARAGALLGVASGA